MKKLTDKELLNLHAVYIKFIARHCEMKDHWCQTGEPIPIDARAFPVASSVILRKRHPCIHYKQGIGCIHPNHPRFSADWVDVWNERHK